MAISRQTVSLPAFFLQTHRFGKGFDVLLRFAIVFVVEGEKKADRFAKHDQNLRFRVKPMDVFRGYFRVDVGGRGLADYLLIVHAFKKAEVLVTIPVIKECFPPMKSVALFYQVRTEMKGLLDAAHKDVGMFPEKEIERAGSGFSLSDYEKVGLNHVAIFR